jgi:hypothetical protein
MRIERVEDPYGWQESLLERLAEVDPEAYAAFFDSLKSGAGTEQETKWGIPAAFQNAFASGS